MQVRQVVTGHDARVALFVGRASRWMPILA